LPQYSAAVVEWREDGGPDRGSIGSGTSGAGSGRVPGGKGFWRRAGIGNYAGECALWIAAGDRGNDRRGPGHRRGVLNGRILPFEFGLCAADAIWKDRRPGEPGRGSRRCGPQIPVLAAARRGLLVRRT